MTSISIWCRRESTVPKEKPVSTFVMKTITCSKTGLFLHSSDEYSSLLQDVPSILFQATALENKSFATWQETWLKILIACSHFPVTFESARKTLCFKKSKSAQNSYVYNLFVICISSLLALKCCRHAAQPASNLSKDCLTLNDSRSFPAIGWLVIIPAQSQREFRAEANARRSILRLLLCFRGQTIDCDESVTSGRRSKSWYIAMSARSNFCL